MTNSYSGAEMLKNIIDEKLPEETLHSSGWRLLM
jgi:hypothetical protein